MFLFIYFSSKLAFLSHLEMTEKQFDYNDFYTCNPPPPPSQYFILNAISFHCSLQDIES